jgi:hypothetical protein
MTTTDETSKYACPDTTTDHFPLAPHHASIPVWCALMWYPSTSDSTGGGLGAHSGSRCASQCSAGSCPPISTSWALLKSTVRDQSLPACLDGVGKTPAARKIARGSSAVHMLLQYLCPRMRHGAAPYTSDLAFAARPALPVLLHCALALLTMLAFCGPAGVLRLRGRQRHGGEAARPEPGDHGADPAVAQGQPVTKQHLWGERGPADGAAMDSRVVEPSPAIR